MAFINARPSLAALCIFGFSSSTVFADDLVISGTPAATVNAGVPFDFHPQAVAAGPLPAYFEIENAPPWASFESFDGRLSGVPSPTDAGTYPGITITITNGESRVSLPTFSLTVLSADGTPNTSISWTPPTENEDGSPLTDLACYYIYEGPSADTLVPIALADPAASSLVIGNLAAGPHYFAITALNTSSTESALSVVVSDSKE